MFEPFGGASKATSSEVAAARLAFSDCGRCQTCGTALQGLRIPGINTISLLPIISSLLLRDLRLIYIGLLFFLVFIYALTSHLAPRLRLVQSRELRHIVRHRESCAASGCKLFQRDFCHITPPTERLRISYAITQ